MALNKTLKDYIKTIFYTNGNEKITGQTSQDGLVNLIDKLGDPECKGMATPTTNPGTATDGTAQWYFASTPGYYIHFGFSVLANQICRLYYNHGTNSWVKEVIATLSSGGGSYTHPIYDPFDINTIGGEVITEIITDAIGSVQHVGTRQLSPDDIGAAYEDHTHDYDNYQAWALAVDSSAAVLIYKNGSNSNYQGVRFKAGSAIQLNQATGIDKFRELTIENTKPFDQFNIKIGGTQAFAILNLEALNLIAGSNITLTPNSGNKSVTISANTGDNYEAWSFDINGYGSVLIYKNASGSIYQGVRLLAGDGINIVASSSADKFAVATIENTKPFDQFNIKVNGTQAFAILNLEALNLIAGSNVTITPNAGNKSVTISAASGSARTYKRAVLIESDFYTATAYAVPGIVGAAISSGTVSGASVDGKHPGTVILKDSTTANGGYQYMTELYAFLLNTTNTDYIVHYEATLIFKMTTVTATTILRFGFFNSDSVGTEPTYGYYMETVCNGSTFNCKLRCYNSSLINSVDGTVNLSANTWYRAVLTIGRDSLGIYAKLIIYDESGVVLTSTGLYQLPQLSAVCGFGVQAGETTTSATANLVYLDYIKLDGLIELTR